MTPQALAAARADDAKAPAVRELALRALKVHLAHGSLDHEHWGSRPHTMNSIDNTIRAGKFALVTKNSDNKKLVERAKAYATYAANVRSRSKTLSKKETPLMHAIRLRDIDAVYDMLSNSGHVLGHARHYPYPARQNVHQPTDTGLTPLHVAAQYSHGKRDIVDFLIKKGADVNARDYRGQTPLHIAVVSAQNPIPAITALLEAGASVHVRDYKGRSPLHLITGKYTKWINDVARLLIAHGADLRAQNDAGKTPLDLVMFVGLHAVFMQTLEAEARQNRETRGARQN